MDKLTVGEADEGHDGVGITVFTVPVVWQVTLGKLIKEVLRGLLGFDLSGGQQRKWRSRAFVALLSHTTFIKKLNKKGRQPDFFFFLANLLLILTGAITFSLWLLLILLPIIVCVR